MSQYNSSRIDRLQRFYQTQRGKNIMSMAKNKSSKQSNSGVYASKDKSMKRNNTMLQTQRTDTMATLNYNRAMTGTLSPPTTAAQS